MNKITKKQINANKINSKLGGVKTKEGKRAIKYNAIKHGLLTKHILLPNENKLDFRKLSKVLRAELKPANTLELILTDQIISKVWRLRRALHGEKEMIKEDMAFNQINPEKILNLNNFQLENFAKFSNYELYLERSLYKAIHELLNLQSKNSSPKNGFVSLKQ